MLIKRMVTLFFCFIMVNLSGCFLTSLMHTSKEEDRIATCKELKKQMIWNNSNGSQKMWTGATGDQMSPSEQRGATETLLKNYREEGCE